MHKLPTAVTEKVFDQFTFSVKRRSNKGLSTKCLYNTISPVTQDNVCGALSVNPIFAELAETITREIDIHESWVNTYQRSKTALVDKIYHLFEQKIRDFFKPGVKVS